MSNFDQKSLSAPYLLNQMIDSDQTFMYCNIGIVQRFDLIFGDLDLIFKVTTL